LTATGSDHEVSVDCGGWGTNMASQHLFLSFLLIGPAIYKYKKNRDLMAGPYQNERKKGVDKGTSPRSGISFSRRQQ
jgi:hypothetical protein